MASNERANLAIRGLTISFRVEKSAERATAIVARSQRSMRKWEIGTPSEVLFTICKSTSALLSLDDVTQKRDADAAGTIAAGRRAD